MLNEERKMNRAEHPCYKCKEMPPWKLHIMLRGEQSDVVPLKDYKLQTGCGGTEGERKK